MKAKFINSFLMFLIALLLGGIVASIIWVFFQAMNISRNFLWEFLPEKTGIFFLPIIICVLGGIIIILYRKKFGELPETLDIVMYKYKKNGTYPYNNLHIIFIAALLPIIFGGLSVQKQE